MDIRYYLVKNGTDTAAKAPYTIRVVPNGVANLNDLVSEILTRISSSEQRVRMVVTEATKVMLKHVLAGETVDFGGIRFKAQIPGSMDYEDSPFTPGVDEVIVCAYVDDELRDTFDGIVPVKLSAEEVAASIKVHNVMDVATEDFGEIHGTAPFKILGNGVTLDGEGESAKLLDKKTGAVLATAEVETVVDDAPGESVKLSPLPVRMKPNYLFYAARPGTIRFSARQRPVGSSKPHQARLVLSRFRGEKIAELPAPAVGGSDYSVEVPAKGFYRLYWPMEWVSTMTMTASDAPVALSGLAEYDKWGKYSIPFLQGEPAEAYFPVRESSGPFAAACNGIERGKVRATLTDPSGTTVFERDGVGLDEVYVSSETPRAGLWTIAAARASKGDFNNYYFDLGGDVPPLLFLSKRKYWIGK